MLLLVTVSIVLLALFLRTVETEEEDRRRTADAQWLDQTLHFHFRRLERDLGVLALQAQRSEASAPHALSGGQLWKSADVIAYHDWLAVDRQPTVATWPLFLQAAAQHPDNAEALSAMLKTTRGLQRAAYAGPLLQADGTPGQMLWLAVPMFERDRFIGDYVAAIRFDRVLASVVPSWFFKDHALALDTEAAPLASAESDNPLPYFAPINLPGAPLRLRVAPLNSQPALAPRIFFGVALICLAAMLVALYFLRRDTARRQRAESQLQTQMALRTAMERSITLGLRAWDQNGRLLYANQTFCRMVGLTPQNILGQTEGMPYWPAEQGDEFQLLKQSLTLPMEQQVGVEMQLRHREGHRLDVLAHGAPLTLVDGRVIGWMGSVLDITERKRTERLASRRQEILEASGRLIAVGEVASTLAHELNQPLGALSSFANGLLNRMREGRMTLADVAPVVERMERLAEKAGRVIQRVNAFARRQEMSCQPLELIQFITRVVGNVPLPDGLKLEMRLPDNEVTLPADVLLLEHALHNVVLNATEWAIHGDQAPAFVRISLEQTGTMAGIRVEDSGPGVPQEQRNSIFDAFASEKAGGMGMGLSICRSIIEAHHGRIDVERSAELNGAQFTLWLPLNP
ncbi:sensor histidine kinase [Polaromonas jejuensis]|uniref:histidine kinase n=1 Tax=Polaromonas jejuensis TaxID=457502 RepID=A0ABW0Q8F4_9BURK|nr:ATP-binding protein [Polaromonas jejuensis]